MPAVLRFYPAERRFLWRGQDWLIGARASTILCILLETPGRYVLADAIASRIWKASRPDYWRNRITDHCRELAMALHSTSAELEPAAKGWGPGHGGGVRNGSRYYAGFRVNGQIEVIGPAAGICPCCGKAMEG